MTPAAAKGYSHSDLVPSVLRSSLSYTPRSCVASHMRLWRDKSPPLLKSVAGSTPCQPISFHLGCFTPPSENSAGLGSFGNVRFHSSRSDARCESSNESYGTSTRAAISSRRLRCVGVSLGEGLSQRPREARRLRIQCHRSKGASPSSSVPMGAEPYPALSPPSKGSEMSSEPLDALRCRSSFMPCQAPREVRQPSEC